MVHGPNNSVVLLFLLQMRHGPWAMVIMTRNADYIRQIEITVTTFDGRGKTLHRFTVEPDGKVHESSFEGQMFPKDVRRMMNFIEMAEEINRQGRREIRVLQV